MKTKDITLTGLMAALIFIGTFFFKIPSPFGYNHFGDGFMLLTVFMLGYKKGAFAGAIGAGLADLIGGYTVWVLPTIVIKSMWALIIGLFMVKLGKNNKIMPYWCRCRGNIPYMCVYISEDIPVWYICCISSSSGTYISDSKRSCDICCVICLCFKGWN